MHIVPEPCDNIRPDRNFFYKRLGTQKERFLYLHSSATHDSRMSAINSYHRYIKFYQIQLFQRLLAAISSILLDPQTLKIIDLDMRFSFR